MNIASLLAKARYFSWCAAHRWAASTGCPACEVKGRLLKRKFAVSALYECRDCGLRFRVPKDSEDRNARFYNGEYSDGISAAIPSEAELDHILRDGLSSTWGGDYSRYLPVFAAAGVLPGQTVEDFGAAWGYGAYQLHAAGYQVLGYEIDDRRAQFAAQRMGIRMIGSAGAPDVPVDCFFSSHVLEHLPNPSILWNAAKSALKPGGVLICFMPNGDPEIETNFGKSRYHKCWGAVHPLMVTSRYLHAAAAQSGFVDVTVHSSPYDLDAISESRDGARGGMELAVVARKPA